VSGSSDLFRVHDLSDISQTLYRRWLRPKWIGNLATSGFLALAGLVFVAYSALGALPHGFSGRSLADVVLAVFFFSGAGLLYFVGNNRTRRPATSVELRLEALVIHYGSRASNTLKWSDPSFRLRISRMRSETLAMEISHVLFWLYPRLFMTDDVRDAIVAAAKSRGLDVATVNDGDSNTGTGILIRHVSGAN
jgi:hypothetical protein